MENYKPNSHKYKEEQAQKKKIEKVANGKKHKKTGLNKFASSIFEDDADSVKSYIVGDIIIPYIKKTISDVVNAVLFPGGSNSKRPNSSHVSYQSYYGEGRNASGRRASTPVFDDVILDTRGEAEDVLDSLDEMLSIYGQVSVNDLYDLVGITGVHTGNNFGWDNLRNARVVRAGDGYLLKMPRIKPL